MLIAIIVVLALVILVLAIKLKEMKENLLNCRAELQCERNIHNPPSQLSWPC